MRTRPARRESDVFSLRFSHPSRPQGVDPRACSPKERVKELVELEEIRRSEQIEDLLVYNVPA
jgi:hypothetical protein